MSESYSKTMLVSEAGGPHVLDPDNDGDIDLAPGMDLSSEDLEQLQKAKLLMQEKIRDTFAALASDVEGKLTKRMSTRKAKENQWLESMRMYLGSLSSYNIVTGEYPFGSKDTYSSGNDQAAVHRPEFNIIRQKCNVAIAQTIAYQFAAGDKNWNLRTPQVIDMDQQDYQVTAQSAGGALSLVDAADMRTDLMEREIENHLTLTKYPSEARKAMVDRAILGTGVLKGPMNAGKLKRIYEKQQTSDGRMLRVPKLITDKIPCVYRVNLWYWFPDDSVTESANAEDSIEVHPWSKGELIELLNHPGYIAEQIKPCLEEEPRQYTNSPFNDPAYLTQGINLLKNKYLVLEYHGPIKKCDLELLGVDYDDDSPLDEVYGEIWVCNSRVIRLQLSAIEGCYKIPYAACVWEPDPACIFGFGIPMLARDQQRVVNETYKMVLDNAGISAGPQVVVDTTIISPAEGGLECTPWKVWYAKEYGADVTKAINFFTPINSFDQLSALLDKARGFADEESSINLLQAGQSPTGQSDSATGLALMNENALTPLFLKSEEWDDKITRQVIEWMYDWEMQYNPKDEVKGTFDIDVRTSTAYLKGLMDQQKLDRLFQEITQGSPAAEWINMDELVQARFSIMKLPSSNIVKTPQQVAQERANKPPPQPDPNMLKAQAMLQQNEIDKQRLALETSKMQVEQQRHQIDTSTQLAIQQSTNDSKERQHEIDLTKAKIEYAGKAAESQTNQHNQMLTMAAQMSGTQQAEQTKKQLGGLKHAEHVQKLGLEQQKIAAQERMSHEKQETELKKVRVNADARQVNQANRDLTKHNPKPK
jgi:hypothetical protein